MLQALIFDVDGTLSETEEVHREAFNAVFAENGLDWHWDQPTYGRLLKVTGGKERIAHFIETDRPPGVPTGDVPGWIAAMHKRKTAIYTDRVTAGAVELRPGVVPLIESARAAGIRLAIATTTSLPNVESLLAATLGADWAGVFEVIAAGDQVERKKPAPDVFDLALERLALPAAVCVALEDSTNGLESALGAGLPTLVTRSVYTREQSFPGALQVIDGLEALGDGRQILAAIRALHKTAEQTP